VEHLLDEACLEELPQLYFDRPAPLFIKVAQLLLHGAGVRQDIKGVLGDLPQDAWHIRGAPCNDVSVGTEEVDEHHFLFRVEGRTDPQRLALEGSRVEGHLLGLLSSLEVAEASAAGATGTSPGTVDRRKRSLSRLVMRMR
jgi:hypothetical protein